MTTINYQNNALKMFVERFGIVRTHMARLFKQTNNVTVERWLAGKDIYLGSLLTISNTYKLDLLSFFDHDGKPFSTTIEEIVRMEDAGLTLKDLLREKDLDMDDKECNTLSGTATTPSTTASQEQEQKSAAESIAILPTDILDKFIDMQTRAYTHEQASLNQQRQDLQIVIEHKDALIAELQKEIKKLRSEAESKTKNTTQIAINNN